MLLEGAAQPNSSGFLSQHPDSTATSGVHTTLPRCNDTLNMEESILIALPTSDNHRHCPSPVPLLLRPSQGAKERPQVESTGPVAASRPCQLLLQGLVRPT